MVNKTERQMSEIHEKVSKIRTHDKAYSGIKGIYNSYLKKDSLRIIKEKIGPIGNRRILDIGCGDGPSIKYILKILKLNPKNYYGIDISKTRLSRAAKTIKTNLKEAYSHKLPFKDGFFDIILINEVIEHTYYPRETMQEIFRVLKKGGLCFIDFPNETNLRVVNLFILNFPLHHPGHLQIITPSKIRKWSKRKFTTIFTKSYPITFFPFMLCINYFMILKKPLR